VSSDHIKHMEDAAEQRRRARRSRHRSESSSGEQHAPGTDVEPRRPGSSAGVRRPQPFTPDLIPEPVPTGATGDLTPDEIEDLRTCERAFAHADQAEWMRGKAAHAVRERDLHRPRTWAQYCEEVLCESESEVNRMIQEWPLGWMIAQIWVTIFPDAIPLPTPSSHKRALAPLVDLDSLEATARGYVMLRMWARNHKERVTEDVLKAMVKQRQLAGATVEEPLPVAEFLERKKAKALEGRKVPTQPTATKRSETPSPSIPQGPTPAPETLSPEPPQSAQPESQPHPGAAGPETDTGHEEPSEVIDAEIIDDNQEAAGIHQAMQQMREGIDSKLRGADPAVLKAIITLGEEITSAAREELAQPRESTSP